MHINYIRPISFAGEGIIVQQGGMDYVRREGGETAVLRLNNAKEKFENSRWQLTVNEQGYTLTAPNTKKSHSGPFSVKRLLKKGAKREKTTSLVIRMDKLNRVKYPIELPNMNCVNKFYNAIKNSHGLEKMLLILSVLEKNI